MRWQGRLGEGTVTEQVGITMDLLPSFLAEEQIATPPDWQPDGENIFAMLRQEKPVKPTLFWCYRRGHTFQKSIRYDNWKYLWMNGREGLYDVDSDLHEDKNLLDERPDLARQLRTRLTQWESQMRAPRLAEFYRNHRWGCLRGCSRLTR